MDNQTILTLVSRLVWARLGYKIAMGAYRMFRKRFYSSTETTPEAFYEIKEEWLLERMKHLGIENKPTEIKIKAE